MSKEKTFHVSVHLSSSPLGKPVAVDLIHAEFQNLPSAQFELLKRALPTALAALNDHPPVATGGPTEPRYQSLILQAAVTETSKDGKKHPAPKSFNNFSMSWYDIPLSMAEGIATAFRKGLEPFSVYQAH